MLTQQIKINLSVLVLIFLPSLIGGFLVLLYRDNLLPNTLDKLVYPFDTVNLFYGPGRLTFHFAVISLLYLLFGALVYFGYEIILKFIRKIKYKGNKSNDKKT